MTYAPYYLRLVPERNRATATRIPEDDDAVGRPSKRELEITSPESSPRRFAPILPGALSAIWAKTSRHIR